MTQLPMMCPLMIRQRNPGGGLAAPRRIQHVYSLPTGVSSCPQLA